MKTKIQYYVDELQNTIRHASLNYEIWWSYEGRGRGQYLNVLNRYPLFFTESIHAHFTALIVASYRLFEPRRDTFNLPGLIELLEKENILDSSTQKVIALECRKATRLWKKVSILRNNIYAHRNNDMSCREIYKKAKITPNELKDLVELTKTIINKLTQQWNRSTHAFNLSATGDTKQLLNDLRKLTEKKPN